MTDTKQTLPKRTLYLMLPMFNEENAIVALLENVAKVAPKLKEPLKVVVVDDGSSDKSVERVNGFAKKNPALPVTVLPHPQNMGLGQAMRTGIYNLAKTVNDNDLVFTMDADNTHNPEHMLDMVNKIDSGNELVIASRYCSGGDEMGLKLYRSILSRGASGLLGSIFRCKGVRDYTCGYRAYKGRLLKETYSVYGDTLMRENGFTCMAELLIKTHPFAKGADEVPLVLRYDLKAGASKMKIVRTIFRYFHLIRALLAERKKPSSA